MPETDLWALRQTVELTSLAEPVSYLEHVELASLAGPVAYLGHERYEGEWFRGREGYGRFSDHSGSVYAGQWMGDEKSGRGTMIHADGGRYDGYWRRNLPDGFGKRKFALPDGNVEIYEGQWVGGKKEGRGVYYHDCGNIYCGEWSDDRCHGQGAIAAPPDEYCIGRWDRGVLGGDVSSTFTCGGRYHGEGDWKTGKLNGQGTYWFPPPSDSVYTGEWADGWMHGFGRLVWTSGSDYSGEWVHGKQHGRGTIVFPSGVRQTGKWHEGHLCSVTSMEHTRGDHHGTSIPGRRGRVPEPAEPGAPMGDDEGLPSAGDGPTPPPSPGSPAFGLDYDTSRTSYRMIQIRNTETMRTKALEAIARIKSMDYVVGCWGSRIFEKLTIG